MKRSDAQLRRDADDLARLGYAQQLLRRMGGFGSFALSFSIISILTGAVTLYTWGLSHGGPAGIVFGWILVSAMTLAVAASMAELASAYPTAGALYHWSLLLGGPGWGFSTAWLNTLGQFAITAGIDYGLAEFVVSMLRVPGGRSAVLAVFSALLVTHALLNHVGIRVVTALGRISAWYHMLGVIVLAGVLTAFAPHQPPEFLLRTERMPDHGLLYTLALGLLQAQWTFTGYDASAHVTEETVDPRHAAPWGIFLSVAVSAVFGLALLCAVTLAIPDLGAALAADNAFIAILRGALGDRLGSAFIWMCMGAMWFCGLASVTSCSRMLFAFARDGGLGAGGWFAAVSPRFRTPHRAVWISVAMAFLVALWSQAMSVVVAISTIALYGSYVLPIALSMVPARRRRMAVGPWSLGRASRFVAGLSTAWVAIIAILFVLPPNQRVGYTFAGCLLLLWLYWTLVARVRFRGPSFAIRSYDAAAEADHGG